MQHSCKIIPRRNFYYPLCLLSNIEFHLRSFTSLLFRKLLAFRARNIIYNTESHNFFPNFPLLICSCIYAYDNKTFDSSDVVYSLKLFHRACSDTAGQHENPCLNEYSEASLSSPATTNANKILTVETIPESLSEDSANHWSGTSSISGKSGITSNPCIRAGFRNRAEQLARSYTG